MAQFTDDFNRADNADLGADYTPASGFSALRITSNAVRVSATGAECAEVLTSPSIGADQYARVRVSAWAPAAGDSWAGVLARASTGGAGYLFYAHQLGEAELYDQESGKLAEVGSALSADAILDIVTRGTTVLGFIDRVLTLAVTSASIASGQPGLDAAASASTGAAGVQLDDFAAGDLPVVTPVAGTVASAASGNVTPGAPASSAEHDLLVMVVHSRDQIAHTMSGDWTERFQSNGGGSTSRLSIWTHQRGASDPASFQVTHTGGDTILARCFRLRAFEAGQRVVFDVVGTAGTGTDNSIEHPAVTPSKDFALVCFVNGAGDDNGRTTPAGVNLLFTDTTTSGGDGSLSVMYRDAMAASTGAQTITQAAADPYCGVQIAFVAEEIPAGGGFQAAWARGSNVVLQGVA